MAIQEPSGSEIVPSRYLERRALQFVGGNVDPATGNIIPVSKTEAAGTVTPPAPPAPPEPEKPQTKLGEVDAEPEVKPPSTGALLASAAAPVVGATLGSSVGSQVASGVPLGEAIGTTASNAVPLLRETTKTALGLAPAAPVGAAPAHEAAHAAVSPTSGPGLGSTVGGAAGAGLLSFAADVALGAKPKEAAKGAVASAVGYAIGNAILPGIGGIVGSFLGKIFCHVAGTLIRLEDGTLKKIEDLDFGDRLLLGGAIVGLGRVKSGGLYRYLGTVVVGRHAVFEDGRWLRVWDSPLAEPVAGEATVYPIVTEQHLLVCQHYVCADHVEVDEDVGADERLALLNGMTARNARLDAIARQLPVPDLDHAA